MGKEYEEFLPTTLPPPLRRQAGAPFAAAIGKRLDVLTDLYRDAVLSKLPGFAPSDALEYIGQERQLRRGAGENEADYRERLRDAWDIWAGDNTPITGVGGGAGSHLGMLKALASAGLPVGPTGAIIVQQNGRYAHLDGSGSLVLGDLMDCVNRTDLSGAINPRPGWTFEARDNFYSAFAIVFPAPALIISGTLNSVVQQWKPSKALYLGAVVIQAGALLGWPASGRTLATEPPLGGNVTVYYPPASGDDTRIGYSP